MADGAHTSAPSRAEQDMELRLTCIFNAFWERLEKIMWPSKPGTQPEDNSRDPAQEAPLRLPARTASSLPRPHELLRTTTPLPKTQSITKGNHSRTKTKHTGGTPIQQQRRKQPHRPAATQPKRGKYNRSYCYPQLGTDVDIELTGVGQELRLTLTTAWNRRDYLSWSPNGMPACLLHLPTMGVG
ncbi:Hypothetical predicted protein [Pelobates cultripes]|uniref:Uncharacterized protein n=1 Tax=Pelobates cultripes TaxID=61616 RepID=A0AAD1RE66_PELCU|nr:Hypothetical predicted protein [Pelobates cultripes]